MILTIIVVLSGHRSSAQRSTPDDQEVACPCGLLWCYRCQAPWHHNMTCQEYIKGDLLFKEWAKDHIRGQANAKRCPKCKVGGRETGDACVTRQIDSLYKYKQELCYFS